MFTFGSVTAVIQILMIQQNLQDLKKKKMFWKNKFKMAKKKK